MHFRILLSLMDRLCESCGILYSNAACTCNENLYCCYPDGLKTSTNTRSA